MRQTILIGIFSLLTFTLFAQTKSDTIKIDGGKFERNGQSLSARQLLDITSKNVVAHNEMQTAKDNLDAGNVFGAIGGALVGYPLGTALAGGNANWYVFGAGVALVLLEIPFFVAYKSHARSAVAIYNKGLKTTASTGFNLKIGFACNGIGIKMQF
jgi:hypothetical protein